VARGGQLRVDPARGRPGRRLQVLGQHVVTGGRVVPGQQQEEQRGGVDRAVVAAVGHLAQRGQLAGAQLVRDLAGFLDPVGMVPGALRGGQGAQRAGGQLRPVRQREQRRDQAVPPEQGEEPGRAGGRDRQAGRQPRQVRRQSQRVEVGKPAAGTPRQVGGRAGRSTGRGAAGALLLRCDVDRLRGRRQRPRAPDGRLPRQVLRGHARAFQFAIEDPLTNAVLAASDDALASIAGEVGADPRPHRSKAAGIAMAFKLIEAAQDRWRAVNGAHLVAPVRAGATFKNGKLVERPSRTSRDQAEAGYQDLTSTSLDDNCSDGAQTPGQRVFASVDPQWSGPASIRTASTLLRACCQCGAGSETDKLTTRMPADVRTESSQHAGGLDGQHAFEVAQFCGVPPGGHHPTLAQAACRSQLAAHGRTHGRAGPPSSAVT
jgi:hypothetical protein